MVYSLELTLESCWNQSWKKNGIEVGVEYELKVGDELGLLVRF
jgi:hypothetical protein